MSVNSLKEIVENNLPKAYTFQCNTHSTTVVSYDKEQAISKFYLSLNNELNELGTSFSKRKCFNTTVYQRVDRFMVLEGEDKLGLVKKLDIATRSDFLSRERLKKLVDANIIKMKIIGLNDTLNISRPEYSSDSETEKYTEY